MDINNGNISGRVIKCEQLTTQRGTGFASLTIGVAGFKNGQEMEEGFSFAFFREAADVCASLQPGMKVLVSYKLKLKDNGYSDLQTTGITVLGNAGALQQMPPQTPQQAPQQPQAYRQQASVAYSTAQSVQAPATPYQQNAQRAQQAAYGVPQPNTDEMF